MRSMSSITSAQPMKELRQIRMDLGWSQRKLAEIARYPKERICQWELGRRIPSIVQFEDLARALGVHIDLVELEES
jgi:transcriptional regulator with XRE-family HTH domain